MGAPLPWLQEEFGTWICGVCGVRSNDEKLLQTHLETSPECHAFCALCEQSYDSLAELKEHDGCARRGIRLPCDFCGEVFTDRDFEAHCVSKHAACNACMTYCPDTAELRRHIAKAHAQLYCKKCDRLYSSAEALAEHEYVRHQVSGPPSEKRVQDMQAATWPSSQSGARDERQLQQGSNGSSSPRGPRKRNRNHQRSPSSGPFEGSGGALTASPSPGPNAQPPRGSGQQARYQDNGSLAQHRDTSTDFAERAARVRSLKDSEDNLVCPMKNCTHKTTFVRKMMQHLQSTACAGRLSSAELFTFAVVANCEGVLPDLSLSFQDNVRALQKSLALQCDSVGGSPLPRWKPIIIKFPNQARPFRCRSCKKDYPSPEALLQHKGDTPLCNDRRTITEWEYFVLEQVRSARALLRGGSDRGWLRWAE
ncbi:uncharacterized protein PFL1_03736 [Pseudozyma flocculosa PF-1]|uniref:C2H2-type domain-containing protein n=2 Tax=Pseudozyma flocculosa TaxID=84751 RepID=A0A5C3F3L9_9BASI|nr:uncharacterized protein PFL1_03736 [Pseudozyma flocculosa PF-1]EPQ28936.1 hypothetical protein PFL1_03736 [Pseudozyma flocculosa PF-1]SPO38575.1 uncharacterized protein PSFLO_04053 [Pseudozyma flocculosa]